MEETLKRFIITALFFVSVVGLAFAEQPGTLLRATAQTPSGGFLDIVLSGGVYGLLNWAGIFLLGILALPLGVLSIIHSSTSRSPQWPLTTKLLPCVALWLFILGWVGVAQGIIHALSVVCCSSISSALMALVAINSASALYSFVAALFFFQFYLLSFVVSLMILHFKHRRMSNDSQPKTAGVSQTADSKEP